MPSAGAKPISTLSASAVPNKKVAHGTVTFVERVAIGANGTARRAIDAPTGSRFRVSDAIARAGSLMTIGS